MVNIKYVYIMMHIFETLITQAFYIHPLLMQTKIAHLI